MPDGHLTLTLHLTLHLTLTLTCRGGSQIYRVVNDSP